MIIYLAISCITLSFCVITFLWVSNKWERKKDKEILAAIMIDDSTTRYIRSDLMTEERVREIFIPLREKKEDFLPKKRMKVHKLVERKQTLVGPGVYTCEVDYSMFIPNRENE